VDGAAGVWIAQLRVVLINCAHPALEDLDEHTYEAMLARVAWHEWADALAVARAGWDDVAAGERLLARAPEGIRDFIRQAGYRRGEHTHELVRRMSGWSE
jgi:hypothetical protein